MVRRPDPAPFGSRDPDPRDAPDLTRWIMGSRNLPWEDQPSRLRPDFFEMLRALRITRVRLVIEAAALVLGALLLAVAPLLGFAIVVVATAAGACDLLLLDRLRRRIAHAWEDLAHGEE